MGLRATVMNRLDKLIEASAIMLKELDSLRRQKREWELERANLLSEQAHLDGKVKDLAMAFARQALELEEVKYQQAQPVARMYGKDNQNG